MSLDKFGLPKEKTKKMLSDLQNATGQFESLLGSGALDNLAEGAIGELKNNLIGSNVLQGMSNRISEANSPNARSKPGATIESEAIHLLSAADVVLNENYSKKIPISKPNDAVQSAIKGMQIESDNLTNALNKLLSSQGSYIDAVARPPDPKQMESLIARSSDMMATYQKVITDKMMEFNLKTLNKEMTDVVSQLPLNQRYKFADVKSEITANTLESFNKISNKGSGLLKSILTKKLTKGSGASNISQLVNIARNRVNTPPPSQVIVNSDNTVTIRPGITSVTAPQVPMCAAEDIIGEALTAARQDIQDLNNGTMGNLNSFIGGVQNQLEELDQDLDDRAIDNTNGGVVTITDEEVENFVRGGSGYTTQNNVGTAFTGNVRPGITTTGDGTGTGLTVNIVVSVGGAGTNDISLVTDGSGYTTATNVATTGGSGSGCKVNITASAGKVTAVTIHTAGGNYKDGDVLTISGGGGDATFRIESVVGAVDRAGITINKRGVGYQTGDVIFIKGGNNDATFTITQVTDSGNVPELSGSSGGNKLGDLMSKFGNLKSSLTSALNFENITSKVFPFELPAQKSLADLYTFTSGGSALPDGQLPSPKNLAEIARGKLTDVIPTSPLSFIQPTKGLSPVNLSNVASTLTDGVGSGLDGLISNSSPVINELRDDVDYLSTSLSQEQREDIINDPNIDIG